MIHPAFNQIPDVTFAEACSEMTQPGSVFTLGAPEQDGFPPKPASITTVAAAYIDETGAVRQRMAMGLSGREEDPQPTEVAELYSTTVGRYQEMAPVLAAILLPNGPRLEEWAVGSVGRQGKRLVAAYVIARTLDSRELVDSLAYSRDLEEETSMRVRDGLVAVVSEVPNTLREHAKDTLGSFIRREESTPQR